jgi:deoxyhypusine synthase
MEISRFLTRHYRHFNAASLVDAADAYDTHLEAGGRMLVTLAGAMSTAELGLSLAEMIRCGKVHAICCTGANLEEDVFNLVAHDSYARVPHWRNLTPEDEKSLERRGMNRVTDTCIPEEEAFRRIEGPLSELWRAAARDGTRRFPHEYLYELIRSEALRPSYQIDPADSWLVAAAEADLPIFVPGWEDSTLGNVFAAHVITGSVKRFDVVKSGPETMARLADWYCRTTLGTSLAEAPELPPEAIGSAVGPAQEGAAVGFFQIGGGIAGDFPICVVPMIRQDLARAVPYWGYFCQISDSTTSYGSYSGAIPSEKITWGKLDVDTPTFVIESDATIVAPLIFAKVLGW